MLYRFCYNYNPKFIIFPLKVLQPLPKREAQEEQQQLETDLALSEDDNPDIDWASPQLSLDAAVRREAVAQTLPAPLKVPQPLPDEWLIMNGLDVAEARRVFATLNQEIVEINNVWMSQRLVFFPSNIGSDSAEATGWPIWAIVVTAISCAAIIAVIVGIIVMYKLRQGAVGTDQKFQMMT